MKLKVMMATDDGENVFLGHPGDARYFRIYEVDEEGNSRLLKELENVARDMEEGESHGSVGKMKRVLEILGDVDVILSTRNSPNLIRMAKETDIQPMVSPKVKTLEDGLRKVVENFEDLKYMVEKRKSGERFDVYVVLT